MDNTAFYLLFLFSEAERMKVINSDEYRTFLNERLDELETLTDAKIERTTNETFQGEYEKAECVSE